MKFSVKRKEGTWSSENPAILKVDEKSGVATAIKDGSAVVTYQNKIKYSTSIDVFKIINVLFKNQN